MFTKSLLAFLFYLTVTVSAQTIPDTLRLRIGLQAGLGFRTLEYVRPELIADTKYLDKLLTGKVAGVTAAWFPRGQYGIGFRYSLFLNETMQDSTRLLGDTISAPGPGSDNIRIQYAGLTLSQRIQLENNRYLLYAGITGGYAWYHNQGLWAGLPQTVDGGDLAMGGFVEIEKRLSPLFSAGLSLSYLLCGAPVSVNGSRSNVPMEDLNRFDALLTLTFLR